MTNRIFLFACVAIATTVGCDQQFGGQRVSVAGQLTLNGQPLTGASIRFISIDGHHDVSTTVSDGHFQVEKQYGPVPGKYSVVVTPLSPELPQAIEAIQSGDPDPLNLRDVPSQYQTPGPLQVTVKADDANDFQFQLSSNGS